MGAAATHFMINGDIYTYSLARRLGFLVEAEYYAFLTYCGLAAYKTDEDTNKTEFHIATGKWKDMLGGEWDVTEWKDMLGEEWKDVPSMSSKELFEVNKSRFDLKKCE